MALTTFPADSRFDLPSWVGQRQATFRFALIDGVTNQPLRDLHPLKGTTPTLAHDTSRTIPRSLRMQLGASDTATLDPINNRVLVYMVTGTTQWPLGRYMFIDSSKQRYSSGRLGSLSLVDEMYIVDQAMETGFSALVTTSTSVSGFGETVVALETVDQTARRLLAPLSIDFLIEGTPFSSIGSWPVGASRAQILKNLATDGDYFNPWLDNNGVLQMQRTFNPDREVPDFDFDRDNKVIAGSIVETDNLLQAANRVVVVSNGVASDENTTGPIVGIFDVASSAPHSLLNRGFTIADVREMQVESVIQATTIARNIAINSTAFEFVDLSTPPDPRHDGYNVVRWDNRLWLETAWSMELSQGGEMRHSLQRIYV